jgi:hypothetical protein
MRERFSSFIGIEDNRVLGKVNMMRVWDLIANDLIRCMSSCEKGKKSLRRTRGMGRYYHVCNIFRNFLRAGPRLSIATRECCFASDVSIILGE